MTTELKILLAVCVALVLMHWATAGQDEIVKGPPDQLFPHSSTK